MIVAGSLRPHGYEDCELAWQGRIGVGLVQAWSVTTKFDRPMGLVVSLKGFPGEIWSAGGCGSRLEGRRSGFFENWIERASTARRVSAGSAVPRACGRAGSKEAVGPGVAVCELLMT
jgi:hypothetical protein